jgi:hypothetical protein
MMPGSRVARAVMIVVVMLVIAGLVLTSFSFRAF